MNPLTTGAAIAIGAITLPVTVPLVVGAAGFGAGGIAAGSWAASFMASYGGAVTAGSACAVLQSIGAAGLGVAENLIAGIVGGAAAGAATGAALANNQTAQAQTANINTSLSNRILTHFAIITGDTTADAFPLEIEASKTVGRLKDLVLTKSPHTPCAISTLANSDSGAY